VHPSIVIRNPCRWVATTADREKTIAIKCRVRIGYTALTITLNGDPLDLSGPLTVAELLASLEIDARRVAVEHNLVVLKRAAFDATFLNEGDSVEIVNFVGGGSPITTDEEQPTR